MVKKVGPETSPRASTSSVGPIYMIKEVDHETSPTASIWPIQPI
jgi:hypothetical protein